MYISKHSGVLSYRHRSHIDKNNLSLALLFSLNELKQRMSGMIMIMYGGIWAKTMHISGQLEPLCGSYSANSKGILSGRNEFAECVQKIEIKIPW